MQPRILSIDVGKARVGIAISDPLGILATPLETVSNAESLTAICKLVQQNQVSTIVISHPLEMSGNEGEQAIWVKEYSGKLEAKLSESNLAQVKLVFWDERLTSVEAERVIRGSKLKNRDRRAAVDRIAAAIILESYLNSLKR